ncbi:MAG TPA: cell envelope integrity protein TolA [Ideonella sp.]|uniref:cell envelope integrity protein TolA n=1 Tax=Ideonella sp. TaxID=1929293 RepID=UPI002E379AFE|nr:cell envelope integrity protein TolA [Ideonella sp.]HEX5686469.1 cell envelope integrity protein TolA [Ideonella sp.]
MSATSSFDPRHPLKSLTIPRDALRPPSADNPRLGIGLSMIAHAGLIIALALGVSWHTEDPAGVAAELWAAVPEIAAPRAQPEPEPEVAPPPPPKAATPPEPTAAERDAEIAIEKAKQDKLEKERKEALDQKAREKRLRDEKERKEQAQKDAEKEKLEREKADAKERERDKLEQQRKDQASAAAREKARQDQLRRMNEQLGGSGAPTSTGTAARDAGPSANYAGRIKARIQPNIQLLFEVPGNPQAEVKITVMPDGTITRWEITKSSGVKEWDDAVLRAVEKTGVLPRDENGRVPSPMVITFSPRPRT